MEQNCWPYRRTGTATRTLLVYAASPRRGDLDGRGNLSEQALIAWADYVLDTCQYPSPLHGQPARL